jgi:hypothetical protein
MANLTEWAEEILIEVLDDLALEEANVDLNAAKNLDLLAVILEQFEDYNGFAPNVNNFNDRQAIRETLTDEITK